MAFLEIKDVAIRGIAACVPAQKDNISDIYKWEGAENFIESTGIAFRRRTDDSVTSSDLCFQAAEKLFVELGWDKPEIDALVFVSQTPDYIHIVWKSSVTLPVPPFHWFWLRENGRSFANRILNI